MAKGSQSGLSGLMSLMFAYFQPGQGLVFLPHFSRAMTNFAEMLRKSLVCSGRRWDLLVEFRWILKVKTDVIDVEFLDLMWLIFDHPEWN